MSRNYANVSTSIWRPEDDFGDLSMAAQWAYFMLITQADISAVGVLSLNVKRWMGRAKDGSRELVVGALQELQAAGKVSYDHDTEELLVRTFVKWDGGYSNRKRRPVIERAAGQVESMALRQVLAREFSKLDLPVSWLRLPPTQGADSLSTPYSTVAPGEPSEVPPATSLVPAPRSPESTFSQVDSLSDRLSHGPSDRASQSDGVVVTQAVVVRPQPSTHIPQPVPPPAAPAVPADAEETAVGLFDAPPPPIDPDAEAKEARSRAFGLARWWIDHRKAQNTPVIAGGKGGPLHPLRTMIEQFTSSYADEEIRQALLNLRKGFPSRGEMDTKLAEGRLGQQRQPSYQPGYEPRGTVALADRRGTPRESAQLRKARDYAEIGAALDAKFMNGGADETR